MLAGFITDSALRVYAALDWWKQNLATVIARERHPSRAMTPVGISHPYPKSAPVGSVEILRPLARRLADARVRPDVVRLLPFWQRRHP
jgi:hypothetical protein